MAVVTSLGLFPAVLFFVLASQTRSESECRNDNDNLICQLQEMKLKVIRLESVLGETIQRIDAKSHYLIEREKLIQDMENKLQYLQSALLRTKGDSSHANERHTLTAPEEEVQLLWAASRKNNFDLHVLHSKVEEAKDRLDVVTSQVEKMADIVTEQWIRIQQLVQALQMAERRAMEAQARIRSTRCAFLKFVNSLSRKHLPEACRILDKYLFGKESTLSSFASQTQQLLKRFFLAARKYHHELQGLIRLEMERNELTVALANKEVVFFLASALITVPILGAWMLLSYN